MEREERKELFNAERREKREYAKRMAEERKKQEEEWQARAEARKQKIAQEKREWELEQLAKINVHPYKKEIEACE